MASSQESTLGKKKMNDNGNGLLLYQYYSCYFCQKVIFAMNEKKLKYKSKIINIYHGEQFEPWFIKLNPKCEVPVLKDGVKIIPDSRRIIDYIEDNFSNGNTPRLMPEKGSPQYQTMIRLRDLLDNVPVPLISFGCIFNPSLTDKIRKSPQEIRATLGHFVSQGNILKDMSEKHKGFRDYYLVKKSNNNKFLAMVTDRNEVEKGLLDLEYALNEVEKVLATHDGDKKRWWLCSEKFTIADVTLCLLLNQLYNLGLNERYFKDNKFSNVQEYFKRAQQRDAFKKTINQSSSILKSFSHLDTKEQVFVTVGSVAVVLAAAGIATFLIHRNK